MHIAQVDPDVVPSGRGVNPLLYPIDEIVSALVAEPNKWFLIGKGDRSMRPRLSNSAAMIRSGRYAVCREWMDRGGFEVRVSGARDAYHAAEFEVGVYARFVPAA